LRGNLDLVSCPVQCPRRIGSLTMRTKPCIQVLVDRLAAGC
jgi:hypothetical protein